MIEHHESCPNHPTCHLRYGRRFADVKDAMSRVPKLPQVSFLPWIGRKFGQKPIHPSRRILLVGESHYEWCARCWQECNKRGTDLTVYCIAERIDLIETPGQQHWLKIENAFLGRNASSDARREFWDCVAYYNFLQEIVGFGPRVPIKSSLWADALKPFAAVLDDKAVQPNLMVVIGRRVWNHLPPCDGVEAALHAGGKTIERRRYQINGGYLIACLVAHPARGLGATWASVLNLAIQATEASLG